MMERKYKVTPHIRPSLALQGLLTNTLHSLVTDTSDGMLTFIYEEKNKDFLPSSAQTNFS